MRLTSADGEWVIEVIRLSLTGDNRDGEWFRVTRHGFFFAEARSLAELRRHVNLDDFEISDGLARNLA